MVSLVLTNDEAEGWKAEGAYALDRYLWQGLGKNTFSTVNDPVFAGCVFH
ncbi:hypothetical protein B4113_2638 [Geobacillus sp. B4113_201601]|nr:hypothetical protein B4113_2638 [Geobacillus sp. B4113_201601]